MYLIMCAEKTQISWCDSTFNPWIGCTKISPACDHCYAEAMMSNRLKQVNWGVGESRKRTSVANWKLPIKWNKSEFIECVTCGWRGELNDFNYTDNPNGTAMCPNCVGCDYTPARRRVFCASLADWLDNEVPIEWLADLLFLIFKTPNIDWLLLTKRIGNWERLSIVYKFSAKTRYEDDFLSWLDFWIADVEEPKNVWIGITICNQQEADRDIPKLLDVPAKVRFLSIEPLLGDVVLQGLTSSESMLTSFYREYLSREGNKSYPYLDNAGKINWVIVGGESGSNARPMHPNWVRSLRDQCKTASVPFFFKQWGEWVPRSSCYHTFADGKSCSDYDPKCEKWQSIRLSHEGQNGRYLRNLSDGCDAYMQKVGKQFAGRLLHGIEYSQFPRIPPCPRCGGTKCRWDFTLDPATQECLNPECRVLVLLPPKKEVANHE